MNYQKVFFYSTKVYLFTQIKKHLFRLMLALSIIIIIIKNNVILEIKLGLNKVTVL